MFPIVIFQADLRQKMAQLLQNLTTAIGGLVAGMDKARKELLTLAEEKEKKLAGGAAPTSQDIRDLILKIDIVSFISNESVPIAFHPGSKARRPFLFLSYLKFRSITFKIIRKVISVFKGKRYRNRRSPAPGSRVQTHDLLIMIS